jgi:hypothetical protein
MPMLFLTSAMTAGAALLLVWVIQGAGHADSRPGRWASAEYLPGRQTILRMSA